MKNQKRILFIGAHPDDADILCGGTAIKLTKAGHIVKFVSATNGDTGHMILSRAETAKIRNKEMAASAKAGGLEYEILPHNCGLEASVDNRREMVRLIRKFKPDVVISHRTCDYHPDHRATAQLVQDTAYVGMVPHFCEDTPIPDVAPVYAFTYDKFVDPRPFRADAAVEIDSVLEEKLKMMSCHKSQFFEWLPWADGDKDIMSRKLTKADKHELLLRFVERFKGAADSAREWLKKIYGVRKGAKVVYAEVFEQSPYSRVVSREEFQKLFEP
ncbi:MAG: PIG-L family deacetylase [Victivallales bacterium]|nr:PIG-L family deacetylase [Victivallales bacterium]